jgi:hypothetical protein
MSEHAWHKKVREEVLAKQKPNRAYSSHSDVSKLELYRVAADERPKRINCLSDADIVVFNPDSSRIDKIIEIESALNPKKVIGIVLATHLCNICRILKTNYELNNVVLKIIFKKAPLRSKKDYKLEVFEPIISQIIRSTNGCLSGRLIFTPHE